MRVAGLGAGIALATLVALVIFASVIASVAADVAVLTSAAGWYGAAAFFVLPALLLASGWRELTR